ncbi:ABC transporter ATP-binding protein [Phaeobacter sp. 22II1-1F12B]|uniref:iron ABC transporter ATP-binding protein n=1 Tax=Phaeobacter sp. 22II1-1F12B TaxID=1317111 RepID=UPI000B528A81|nr:ATP-binding cassette domain-containing protein [Phaeobacter sp. 22II1-1F12B]OWU80500.1 ABC transporter ATP-binding protein [Phaeobacter sp. 22II1-1F12B]
MISIRNVSHAIHGAPILHDISLDLPRGGVTALIGPNGAGKSTLLSLIARLVKLQSGAISVDELEVGKAADRVLAQHLAIMPQSLTVSARLRVGELVMMGRYPWHQGRPGAEDREIIAAALAKFALEPLRDRFLDALSGGQRQRALVAMAYAQGTDYLLLDEPLNNLDIAASRHLMGLLREMAEREGKSIVIVLHDINYAAAFADRIVVMSGGRVAADGAPGEIVNDGLLRDVFDTNAEVRLIDGKPVVLV